MSIFTKTSERIRSRIRSRILDTQTKHLLEAGADAGTVERAAALSLSDKSDKSLDNLWDRHFPIGSTRRPATTDAPTVKYRFRLGIRFSEDRSPAAKARRLAQLEAIEDANVAADVAAATAHPSNPSPLRPR
jgi:hypothetical protein